MGTLLHGAKDSPFLAFFLVTASLSVSFHALVQILSMFKVVVRGYPPPRIIVKKEKDKNLNNKDG